MTWTVCTVTEQVARKRYQCESTFILGDLSENDLYEEDKEIFRNLTKDPYIHPGDRYVKAKGLFDGMWQTFRARPEADRLCRKYRMYDD